MPSPSAASFLGELAGTRAWRSTSCALRAFSRRGLGQLWECLAGRWGTRGESLRFGRFRRSPAAPCRRVAWLALAYRRYKKRSGRSAGPSIPSGSAVLGAARPCDGSYLVDSASSHMLVSKIKPCMSKYKQVQSETANGSLYKLSFI
jgi:hypothetical protein